MTPLELENLILLASSPTNSNPAQTTALLDSIRSSPTAPLICLDLLRDTTHDACRLFALTTLRRTVVDHHTSNESVRIDIRQTLFRLANTVPNLPTFVRTSIGVLFSRMVRIDFPHRWGTAFEDLAGNLSRDLFLRVLEGISDEIVDRPTEEGCTLIKDVMRGFCDGEGRMMAMEGTTTAATDPRGTIAGRLVEYMMDCVVSKDEGVLAMGTLRRYCGWLDVELLTQRCMLEVFYRAIQASCPEKEEENLLATRSVECLREIVGRGMEDGRKIVLLKDMDLFGNLIHVEDGTRLNGNQCVGGALWNDETDIYLAIQISELVNDIGIELLACWDELRSQTRTKATEPISNDSNTTLLSVSGTLCQLLHQYMNLFFRCFAYDDIDVTSAVLPCLSRIILSLGLEIRMRNPNPNFDANANPNFNANPNPIFDANPNPQTIQGHFSLLPHIPNLLITLHSQMTYPVDFTFDYTSSEDSEEEAFRCQLYKIYPQLVKILPEQSLSFLGHIFSLLPVPLSSAPTAPLESSLRLLHHHPEKLPGGATALVNSSSTTCRALLEALHESDVAYHPSPAIVMLYYDLTVRYHAIFKPKGGGSSDCSSSSCPSSHLPKILACLSSDRGLQHPHPRVRSRSCYLLMKLVKYMGGHIMRIYVATAVEGIQKLLERPDALPLRPEDTFYLFETMGLLVGQTRLPPLEQRHYLTQVVGPHITYVQSLLHHSNVTRDEEDFGERLSQSIAAIAYLTKGFSNDPDKEVKTVFMETMHMTLAVLRVLPGQAIVRNKTLVLLQRFVLCLGDYLLLDMAAKSPNPNIQSGSGCATANILPFLQLLIEHATTEDILDVSQLLNQLCIKFGTKAMRVLDMVLQPYLHRCRSLLLFDDHGHSYNGPVDFGCHTNPNANTHTTCQTPTYRQHEIATLKKCIYVTLQHITKYRLDAILYSETNICVLENILLTMMGGLAYPSSCDDSEHALNKTCMLFFEDLFRCWVIDDDDNKMNSDNDGTKNGDSREMRRLSFERFVFEKLMPEMIGYVMHPEFDPNDALQARNLVALGGFMYLVKTSCKREFMEWLRQMNWPSASSSEEVIRQFEEAQNKKNMGKCLRNLLKVVKR